MIADATRCRPTRTTLLTVVPVNAAGAVQEIAVRLRAVPVLRDLPATGKVGSVRNAAVSCRVVEALGGQGMNRGCSTRGLFEPGAPRRRLLAWLLPLVLALPLAASGHWEVGATGEHREVAVDASAPSCGTQGSPGGLGGFTPSEVASFYNFEPLYESGVTGEGQTVVFIEVDGYRQADLAMFASGFGLSPFDIAGPIVNKDWGTDAPAVFGKLEPCTSEADLDLEIVHAMAPQAHLVVYDASPFYRGQLSFTNVVAAIEAAVAAYPHAVFSISLAQCEDTAQALEMDSAFARLTAGGGTAFVSSGDAGAYALGCNGAHGLGIYEPADSPHATGVGGTTALVGTGGTYGEEAVWGEPFVQWGAGGGLSVVFTRPKWQTGPGVDNQYSNGMRQVPDVSAIADSDTGWDVVMGGGWYAGAGGTSAAAPLWAAVAALTDQALDERHLPQMGSANPAFYDFGSHPSAFPAPRLQPGHPGHEPLLPGHVSGLELRHRLGHAQRRGRRGRLHYLRARPPMTPGSAVAATS